MKKEKGMKLQRAWPGLMMYIPATATYQDGVLQIHSPDQGIVWFETPKFTFKEDGRDTIYISSTRPERKLWFRKGEIRGGYQGYYHLPFVQYLTEDELVLTLLRDGKANIWVRVIVPYDTKIYVGYYEMVAEKIYGPGTIDLVEGGKPFQDLWDKLTKERRDVLLNSK